MISRDELLAEYDRFRWVIEYGDGDESFLAVYNTFEDAFKVYESDIEYAKREGEAIKISLWPLDWEGHKANNPRVMHDVVAGREV